MNHQKQNAVFDGDWLPWKWAWACDPTHFSVPSIVSAWTKSAYCFYVIDFVLQTTVDVNQTWACHVRTIAEMSIAQQSEERNSGNTPQYFYMLWICSRNSVLFTARQWHKNNQFFCHRYAWSHTRNTHKSIPRSLISDRTQGVQKKGAQKASPKAPF